jgi:hypothetical protein
MKVARWLLAAALTVSAPAFAQWVECAKEDGYCTVNGTAIVRFGAGNKWAEKKVKGGVRCTPHAFGDPAVGVPKKCYVAVSGQASNFKSPPRWEACAREDGNCAFNGTRRVRFGANDKYLYKVASGKIRCSVSSFGGDPTPGVVKSCAWDSNN